MKKAFLNLAAFGVALMVAAPALATTYVGTRNVNGGTMHLSITTDNALGALSTANLVDWTINLNFEVFSVTLFGPLSGGNSVGGIEGTGVTATATDLTFNFDGDGFMFFRKSPGVLQPAYCLDGANSGTSCIGSSAGSENFFAGALLQTTLDGSSVLASAVPGGPGGVPEPATWAMMIIGLGAAGSLIRGRAAARLARA
jgi:hypothetical protein